jgi:drug/metabolite transporter superfamily protein YnfA
MIMRIVVYLFLAGVCLRSISYGIWTWRKQNRLGAVMVFLVALVVLAVPVLEALVKG